MRFTNPRVFLPLLLICVSLPLSALADQTVGKITGSSTAVIDNHQHLVISFATVNGKRLNVILDNTDESKPQPTPKDDQLALIKSVGPDQLAKLDYREDKNRQFFQNITQYTLQPGEELPNAYTFIEVYPHVENGKEATFVDAKRFDQPITFVVPNKKDAGGNMVADPDLVASLNKLQKGQIVLIEATKDSKTNSIRSVELYNKPEEGTLQTVNKEDKVNNLPTVSAEINVGGKVVKVYVPVKTEGTRTVVDARVREKLLRNRPNTQVVFRTTDETGGVFLRDIQPAPKQPKPTASASADKPKTK